jgi:rSAM/selenodomain-associated transferase 2/rSAM/selenodomain-associated transferase 1
MEQRRRLILFARFPVAGEVKTRLIPALGPQGAAALHRRLVLRTLRTARAFCDSQKVALEIWFAGGGQEQLRHWLGDSWTCRPQNGDDLGQRIANVLGQSFGEGSQATVIIGSDCPALSPDVLQAAFEALKDQRVVFGPAEDGGYYLVGLTKAIPELFQGLPWGTDSVLAASLEVLQRSGESYSLLAPLPDIDRPEDVPQWGQIADLEDADLGRVSVIVPALNEAAQIAASLESVFAGSPHEVIVVDGGSSDDTRTLAQAAGATVLQSQPGRARQMNAGAALATGAVLLFLHADTLLPAGWRDLVEQTLRRPGVVAGSFRFKVTEPFHGRAFVEWATNLRSRWLQNPYGDQASFLRRALFEEVGGYADLPIMEDHELNRRLRLHGRIAIAPAPARTSGRRWRRLGLVRASFINRIVTMGYRLGVGPDRLARFYRRSST